MNRYLDMLAMPESSIDISNNYSCCVAAEREGDVFALCIEHIYFFFSYFDSISLSERYQDIEGKVADKA